MNTKTVSLLLIIISLLIMAGCKMNKQAKATDATDYSEDRYWSIKDNIEHDIDVFFVHPTTYGPPANGKFVADLNDEKLNDFTDSNTIDWLTSVFSDECNVFAPRYRQMNIEVLSMDEKTRDSYMQIGLNDVEAAFKYYLNNINNGRPFILASHSQGSAMLKELLLNKPELLNKGKLVAAYMPGWTFTDEDIERIKLPLCESPDQTGCLIVWNTIGPDGNSPTVNKGARCVNPLSWNTKTNNIPASMNIKAQIFISPSQQLYIKNFTAARINKNGALEIPPVREDVLQLLNMSMGKEVYHRYDYDFFFNNVKENVKVRCAAYLEKNK